ncbi:hypothetical protein TNCV_1555131 [Trichonephila clavipes]|nr:hypothetical protein TNCV_1555131 [Trichonephila clavipes]
MKSGFFTRILTEKNLTAIQEHHQQQFQNLYPSMKSTALFVVGHEISSALRVAETGKTINAYLYCNQLDQLNTAIKDIKTNSSVLKKNSVPPR